MIADQSVISIDQSQNIYTAGDLLFVSEMQQDITLFHSLGLFTYDDMFNSDIAMTQTLLTVQTAAYFPVDVAILNTAQFDLSSISSQLFVAQSAVVSDLALQSTDQSIVTFAESVPVFDYVFASSFWSYATVFMMSIWSTSYCCGVVLNFLKVA